MTIDPNFDDYDVIDGNKVLRNLDELSIGQDGQRVFYYNRAQSLLRINPDVFSKETIGQMVQLSKRDSGANLTFQIPQRGYRTIMGIRNIEEIPLEERLYSNPEFEETGTTGPGFIDGDGLAERLKKYRNN